MRRLVFAGRRVPCRRALFDEVADSTGVVALAVVELRRELRNRVAAIDRGEDLEFEVVL